MSDLTRDAAWVLIVTFSLSIVYELYRATIRAGDSEHDSIRGFVAQLPLYVAATAVILVLFIGGEWAAWVGLAFCVAIITVSIAYYNPRIMLDRRPGLLDWFEDLAFTGLLFVAAAQLVYEIA
jgi:phosphatidylserine synthase